MPSSLISSLKSTLARRLFNLRLLIGIPAAFAFGFLIEYAFALFVERSPLSLVAAAVAVFLTALGALLALLPATADAQRPWNVFGAWLQSLPLCGAAFAGVALAPTHHESARTFLSMWALFAGHAAVVCAVYATNSSFGRFDYTQYVAISTNR